MIKNKYEKILIIYFIFLILNISIFSNIDSNVKANNENGLIAYWDFNEGSGEILYEVYHNNIGIIDGANWTKGLLGFGLEFDGLNDYVSVSGFDSLNITENITIEAWIYLYEMPWVAPIIAKGTNSSNFSYYLSAGQYYHNGAVNFQLHSNDTKKLWLDSSYPLDLNKWYFLTVVRTGNIAQIYINGELNNLEVYFNRVIRSNDLPLLFGTFNDYSEFFHGKIDEIRIYDYSLSSSEIYSNYNSILKNINNNVEPNPSNLTNESIIFFLIVIFAITLLLIIIILSIKNKM